MKLVYNSQEDHDDLHSLIYDWLRSRKLEELSGPKARLLFNRIYGIDIDHHEYASVLDWMASIGAAEFTRFGNDNESLYIIK